jgi:cytochrome c biogenesis protein CcmG/thiol:disulfide interchange protein DsbE
MRRHAVPIALSCLAVGLLAVLTYGVSSQGASSSIDGLVASRHYPLAPSSAEALPVLGSSARESLRHFRGRVVLLNVFASWCTPCAQEAPLLESAERMMQRHGGTVLGITYLDNSSDDQAFVHQHHLTYPVLRDVSGSFVRSFGTTGVPESFVIDRFGRIQALRRYQLSTQWIDQTLQRILGARA